MSIQSAKMDAGRLGKPGRDLDRTFTGHGNLDRAFTERGNFDGAFTKRGDIDGGGFYRRTNLYPAFMERGVPCGSGGKTFVFITNSLNRFRVA